MMMPTFSQSIKSIQLEAFKIPCFSCHNLRKKSTFAEVIVNQNHLLRYSRYVIVYKVRQPVKIQFISLFKNYILLIMLLQVSNFSPFVPLCPVHPFPPEIPALAHDHESCMEVLWLLHFLLFS